MKSLALCSLVALTACSAPKPAMPADFMERRVVFQHDEYHPLPHCAIILGVPARYDTLLTWIDRSDNIGSDVFKYRLTNSKGCLIKESGFFKRVGDFCQDTLDRLTIQPHQAYDTLLWTTDELVRNARANDKRDSVLCRIKSVWRINKRVRIDGRTFAISSRKGPGHLFCDSYNQLTARTKFRQNHTWWDINFVFESTDGDSQNFDKRALATLQFVRLDTTAYQLPLCAGL